MSKAHYLRQHRAFRAKPYKAWHLKGALKKYKYRQRDIGSGKRMIDRW